MQIIFSYSHQTLRLIIVVLSLHILHDLPDHEGNFFSYR